MDNHTFSLYGIGISVLIAAAGFILLQGELFCIGIIMFIGCGAICCGTERPIPQPGPFQHPAVTAKYDDRNITTNTNNRSDSNIYHHKELEKHTFQHAQLFTCASCGTEDPKLCHSVQTVEALT